MYLVNTAIEEMDPSAIDEICRRDCLGGLIHEYEIAA
jgi:hypothetical protein